MKNHRLARGISIAGAAIFIKLAIVQRMKRAPDAGVPCLTLEPSENH
jgi:hypothetical protein